MITEPKIRVVLADDHAVLRAGLKALLNAEPDIEVVSQVARGDEVVTAARTTTPDVALTTPSAWGGPAGQGPSATRLTAEWT